MTACHQNKNKKVKKHLCLFIFFITCESKVRVYVFYLYGIKRVESVDKCCYVCEWGGGGGQWGDFGGSYYLNI